MVNICELLINVVKIERAKDADRLYPKREVVRYRGFVLLCHG